MTRGPRIVLPEIPHHVTQRGSRRGLVFFSDEDKAHYLQLLRYYCERYGIEILAYCLMNNHVHHILVPGSPDALANALAATHMRYAQVINGTKGWQGHLWQERFFSSALDEGYLWSAIRYVERNPVSNGMVRHAWEYPWSSAAAHCGLRSDLLLTTDPKWIKSLGEIKNWRDWLEDQDSLETIRTLREQTRRDHPCGASGFIETLEKRFNLQLRQKPRGRPRLSSGEKK